MEDNVDPFNIKINVSLEVMLEIMQNLKKMHTILYLKVPLR